MRRVRFNHRATYNKFEEDWSVERTNGTSTSVVVAYRSEILARELAAMLNTFDDLDNAAQHG